MSKTNPSNVKVHVIELDKDTNPIEAINKVLAEFFGDLNGTGVEPENVVEPEKVTRCNYPNCDCDDDNDSEVDEADDELVDKAVEAMAKFYGTNNTNNVGVSGGQVDEGVPTPTAKDLFFQIIEPLLQEHFKAGLRVANVEYVVDGVTQYFPFLAYSPDDAVNVLNAIKETGKVHSFWDDIDSLRTFMKISVASEVLKD